MFIWTKLGPTWRAKSLSPTSRCPSVTRFSDFSLATSPEVMGDWADSAFLLQQALSTHKALFVLIFSVFILLARHRRGIQYLVSIRELSQSRWEVMNFGQSSVFLSTTTIPDSFSFDPRRSFDLIPDTTAHQQQGCVGARSGLSLCMNGLCRW